MGAIGKLGRLKHEWMVYAVFAELVGALHDGLDPRGLFYVLVRVVIMFAFTWFWIRQLIQKSSLMWAFGVVFGLIGAIAGAIVVVQTIVEASDGNGFELARCLLAASSGYIHFRMFRVLRDREVKRYVMLD